MLYFYLYSISAVTLAATYTGLVGLAVTLFSLASGDGSVRREMAAALGVAVAGAVFWLIHWRQVIALLPAPGIRGALDPWHRFYLFSVSCLAVMAMLMTASVGVARLATGVMGTGLAANHWTTTGSWVAAFLISAVVWAYHWRMLQRWGTRPPVAV
ncbi:MAG: hypothetical protein IT330_13065 [Anaerolineae bacterium]|nr:hypothetical protein [Anaerolineae bacterium]